MTDKGHKERIEKIQAETEEIKRQMMQFEFQHKKDIAEADRRFEAKHDRTQKQIDHLADRTQKQIDHLVKLMGLTYDELDEIDATLTETGIVLTRQRKRAVIK